MFGHIYCSLALQVKEFLYYCIYIANITTIYGPHAQLVYTAYSNYSSKWQPTPKSSFKTVATNKKQGALKKSKQQEVTNRQQ